MGASIFLTAAMIRASRSARSHLICRRVLCVLCTKCTLHSNHRLTRVIFQHTKRLLPRSGHFSLHALASPSGRNVNYDKRNNLLRKNFWVVPSICTGFVNTFPNLIYLIYLLYLIYLINLIYLIYLLYLTYLRTPWSRVLLEKLTINFAASQEIPHIYGTRKFLTVLTSARHFFNFLI
jgi:hypothetical protein